MAGPLNFFCKYFFLKIFYSARLLGTNDQICTNCYFIFIFWPIPPIIVGFKSQIFLPKFRGYTYYYWFEKLLDFKLFRKWFKLKISSEKCILFLNSSNSKDMTEHKFDVFTVKTKYMMDDLF